jgi:hypothetical protein
MINMTLRYFLLMLLSLYSLSIFARPVIEIEIRNHLFYPAEIEIDADTKINIY